MSARTASFKGTVILVAIGAVLITTIATAVLLASSRTPSALSKCAGSRFDHTTGTITVTSAKETAQIATCIATWDTTWAPAVIDNTPAVAKKTLLGGHHVTFTETPHPSTRIEAKDVDQIATMQASAWATNRVLVDLGLVTVIGIVLIAATFAYKPSESVRRTVAVFYGLSAMALLTYQTFAAAQHITQATHTLEGLHARIQSCTTQHHGINEPKRHTINLPASSRVAFYDCLTSHDIAITQTSIQDVVTLDGYPWAIITP